MVMWYNCGLCATTGRHWLAHWHPVTAQAAEILDGNRQSVIMASGFTWGCCCNILSCDLHLVSTI